MIPKTNQTTTDQSNQALKLVPADTVVAETSKGYKSALPPELRAHFEASFAHNEAAYRYLGK